VMMNNNYVVNLEFKVWGEAEQIPFYVWDLEI
jgi:hypothetical protein